MQYVMFSFFWFRLCFSTVLIQVPFPFPQTPSARLPEGAYIVGIMRHAGRTHQGKKIFWTIMHVQKFFLTPWKEGGNLDPYPRHDSRRNRGKCRRYAPNPGGALVSRDVRYRKNIHACHGPGAFFPLPFLRLSNAPYAFPFIAYPAQR